MKRLYADEQFPTQTTRTLRFIGYDILTVQEAGNSNQRISDPDVLAFAIANNRAVLTLNRYDFIRLHKISQDHAGIIVCTENSDFIKLAEKINEALIDFDDLHSQLIRVYRESSKRSSRS